MLFAKKIKSKRKKSFFIRLGVYFGVISFNQSGPGKLKGLYCLERAALWAPLYKPLCSGKFLNRFGTALPFLIIIAKLRRQNDKPN